jgi:hypothetical protein
MRRRGTYSPPHAKHATASWYNRLVLSALLITIAIGGAYASATLIDGRLRIADRALTTFLVCIAAATTGLVLMRTIRPGTINEAASAADAAAAILSVTIVAAAAWRGRRRTFSRLGLHGHSTGSQPQPR